MGALKGMSPEEKEAYLNESRAPQMIAADMVCLILTVLSTAFRLVSKRMARRAIKMDDWAILLGTALCSAYFIGALVQDFHYDFGKHDAAISTEDYQNGSKVVYIVGLFYSSGYYIVKLAILLLYHRIFEISWFRKLNGAVIILNMMIMISMFIVSAIPCRPVAAFWDFSIEDYTCYDSIKFFWAQAIINAIEDFIILFLPLPVLWKLQMDNKMKLGLSLLFGLGGATCIVSIVRVVLYQDYDINDSNYTYIPPSIATDVEMFLAVLCANLPTYKPIGKFMFSTGQPLSCFVQNKVEDLRAEEAGVSRKKSWNSADTGNAQKSRLPTLAHGSTPALPEDDTATYTVQEKSNEGVVVAQSLNSEEKAL